MRGYDVLVYSMIIVAIAIGWVSHNIYMDFHDPEDNVLVPGENKLSRQLDNILNLKSPEIMSPGDHIAESQIGVYNDRVVLTFPEPIWTSFVDTNSMDPLLDVGANGIEMKPMHPTQIHVGDVISYKKGDSVIVHRVISIETDSNGIYYKVKGDNNALEDNVKVRFEDIQGILVAVVY